MTNEIVGSGSPGTARATFAEGVRCERQRLGITQGDLGRKCGLHRSFVSAVERGERNISIDNMQRLAMALDTTIPALLAEVPISRP
jgi:transcriptional regulator with XRE-family HTH domain